jgi:hypothetical protein
MERSNILQSLVVLILKLPTDNDTDLICPPVS